MKRLQKTWRFPKKIWKWMKNETKTQYKEGFWTWISRLRRRKKVWIISTKYTKERLISFHVLWYKWLKKNYLAREANACHIFNFYIFEEDQKISLAYKAIENYKLSCWRQTLMELNNGHACSLWNNWKKCMCLMFSPSSLENMGAPTTSTRK